MQDRIRAVSLDLDDTLWDVAPVLARADARLREWLAERYPRMAALHDPDVQRERRLALIRDTPARAHDLTWIRTESLRRCAREAGYPESVGEEAFEVFYAARNEVDLYPDVREALARLAALMPVYALSNGNACVQRVGLGEYFADAIGAHHAGAAKPDPRIFRHLLEVAGLPAHAVLHVGDDPHTDVAGARDAGLATAWVNRVGREWPAELARADVEVGSLAEVVALLE